MSAESGKVLFTLEKARALVDQVREITETAKVDATPLIEALEDPALDESRRETLSAELQEKLNAWADEISQLGAHPKGLWLVDFDSGSGFYCWKYDEESVDYFHGYEEGFSGRTRIQ